MDIAFGASSTGGGNTGGGGVVEVELFTDTHPRTCENFRALCTGERQSAVDPKRALHYKGTAFHRIVPGFMVQAGDVSAAGDGTGGESIYGETFEDESFAHRHVQPGTLSMANTGKDRNSSQFFITTSDTKMQWLDNKHVAFGKVVRGMGVIRSMERFGREDGTPSKRITIRACGRVKKGAKGGDDANTAAEGDADAASSASASSSSSSSPPIDCAAPGCGGRLRYVNRLPKKQAVRFRCKKCQRGVTLPDTTKAGTAASASAAAAEAAASSSSSSAATPSKSSKKKRKQSDDNEAESKSTKKSKSASKSTKNKKQK